MHANPGFDMGMLDANSIMCCAMLAYCLLGDLLAGFFD
jgi:hypothetical protein